VKPLVWRVCSTRTLLLLSALKPLPAIADGIARAPQPYRLPCSKAVFLKSEIGACK
jgi:hypothetical protein